MTVPFWAEVPAGVSWDEVPVEVKLGEWLESMQPSIAGWLAQLPADFVADHSRESLDRLERIILDRFPDVASVQAQGGSGFLETASRYIGEALLRVDGGRWAWTDTDPTSLFADQPVLHAGPGADAVLVAVFATTRAVVVRRLGGSLGRVWDHLTELREERMAADPGYTPVKEPTPGLDRVAPQQSATLDAFLAGRDDDLRRWADLAGRPATTWDLSRDSLTTLTDVVLASGIRDDDFERPERHTFPGLAARYLGETLLAVSGGVWEWRPNTDHLDLGESDAVFVERFLVRRDDPDEPNTVFPDLALASLVTTADRRRLLDRADRYARIYDGRPPDPPPPVDTSPPAAGRGGLLGRWRGRRSGR